MVQSTSSPITSVFSSVRSGFLGGAGISLVINLLMLTGPLFMLQVYDRVLASGSVSTLVAVGSLAVVLYAFYGILEGLRGRILLRLGLQVDALLSEDTYRWSNILPVRLGRKGASLSPIRDLDTIRQFLAGAGPAAFFDLPWLPLYLGIVFLFHPLLGFVGLAGAVVIFVLILLNEFMNRARVAESNREAASRSANVEIGQRNSEAIAAMGMQPALSSNRTARNSDYLATLLRSTDRSGMFGTIIKTVRFVLQSAVLGVGAWLAIKQEITPGVMIAASIMTSRALAPIEQAVAQWRGFVGFRQAFKRLREGLAVAQRSHERRTRNGVNSIIAGNLKASGILLGGMVLRNRPKQPPFEEETSHVARSLEGLLENKCRQFFLGHGGPLFAPAVKRHVKRLRGH